jgi:hypothetical protein
MTLLIGTVSDEHVVITADGLSLVNPETGGGIPSNTFQKIFPVESLPMAFVHHGFNILGGNPVGRFIEGYTSAHATTLVSSTIKDIAEHFRSYAERDARNVLANQTNKGVVGFWIAGFDVGKGKPELFEICWPQKPAPCKHQPIVFGGCGKDFIERYQSQPLVPFRPDKIAEYSVSFARQYHQALYRQAELKQAKTGQTIFGGHQHQLVLTRAGWEWTRPPK